MQLASKAHGQFSLSFVQTQGIKHPMDTLFASYMHRIGHTLAFPVMALMMQVNKITSHALGRKCLIR